jgi:hypothetical protein
MVPKPRLANGHNPSRMVIFCSPECQITIQSMVVTSPSKSQRSTQATSYQTRKEKHKRAAYLIAEISSVTAATAHATRFLDKERIHTSVLTGQLLFDFSPCAGMPVVVTSLKTLVPFSAQGLDQDCITGCIPFSSRSCRFFFHLAMCHFSEIVLELYDRQTGRDKCKDDEGRQRYWTFRY